MRLFNIMDTAFDRYDDTVRQYLRKTFNNLGLQYTHSQVFGVIFDGMKGIMQNLMFYIEDALTEQNVFKATRKSSVYSLAKLSGYEPHYGSAAVGTLLGKSFVTNGLMSKSDKLYIKNESEIYNAGNGLTYSLILPTEYYVFDITKPLVNHEFKIVQGTFNFATHVSNGTNFEIVNVAASGNFDKNYLTVTVDGEEWEQVTSLYDMTEHSKQYVLSIGFDNTFDVMFGNGVYGRRLNEGQTVIVKYLSHVGAMGNILPDEYTNWAMRTMAYDSLGNGVDLNEYMNFTMTGCVTGGTNNDSINFIRSMIGYNSRSLVYASEQNFKLFFKRFSFIGYVNCWSEKNSMCVTASCLRNMKDEIKDVDSYYKLDTKKMLLDEKQKEMIITTLENSNKAFAGITLKFQDPIIRRYAIICYVKANNTYNKETITNGIKISLANFFLNTFEDVHFIAKSDLISKILNDNVNIRAIDLDIISELAEQTFYDGYYNKYEMRFTNDSYQYVPKRVMYEPQSSPGLDGYGNIQLDSPLEIPVLNGHFNYYPNKENWDKKNSISIETVQVYFI